MDNLLKLISNLNNKLSNYIVEGMEEAGVNDFALSHGNILINFTNVKEMNFRELSKKINKSPQTMTTLVRKLEQEGYLSLKKDPQDKRNKLVSLTQKGQDFLPVMHNISSELYQKQYQNLTESEAAKLKELLMKVTASFDDENGNYRYL